jgi:undecaprenyl-diphosphatase
MTRREVRALERFGLEASAGLTAVIVAGAAFALLLTLVRLRWAPLATLDEAMAAWLNGLVADSDITVNVLRAVTEFGGRNILTLTLLIATGYLLIRRLPRLAGYAAVTSIGALILDPVLKLLVERLRPVVDMPVATAPGPSFPSGHALGSIVSYGVLLLIFLPTVPRRRKPVVVALVAALVVMVGVTRIALGVHYLTDVLGGWALGIAWLGVTAVAFRHWRADIGRLTAPVDEGLAPEAASKLAATTDRPQRQPSRLHAVTESVVAAVLVIGTVVGAGVLVTAVLSDTAIGRADRAAVSWFAAHRSSAWTAVTDALNTFGDTGAVITVTIAASGLALAVFRSWRPIAFLWTVMAGEVVIFLVSSTVVTRARPAVQTLQPDLPPTASFPSGHVAGAICLYAAIALLVRQVATGRIWPTLAWTAAVVIPAGVAVARLYRGVHHPTDVAGSILLAVAWLTAVWFIVRPDRLDGTKPHHSPI